MKKEFAKFMQEQNFKSASELIYETTLKLNVPDNVKLNINTDHEKDIQNLTTQMKNCYDQINDTFSEISFETLVENVFALPQLSEKQNLKTNDQLISKARTGYDNIINEMKNKQYEQIFEATTLTLNSTLQSIINSTTKM